MSKQHICYSDEIEEHGVVAWWEDFFHRCTKASDIMVGTKRTFGSQQASRIFKLAALEAAELATALSDLRTETIAESAEGKRAVRADLDLAKTVARHDTLIQGLKSAVADLSDELVTVRAALRELGNLKAKGV